ncbi:MAG: FAD-dependent oxidoreductase [Phycisphaerales bacterium]|nr:FAD-dependent oxidoreductase [Phycisphaerales bacterium]
MSDQQPIEKVVIIGSGPSGWTAAIYASRANLSPVVYVGVAKQDPGPILPGGQLMLTTDVENYPGFPEGIAGPEMMMKFEEQARRFGTRVVGEDIVRCEFSTDGTPHTLHTSGGSVIRAYAVIVSTGATANWLGLESEMQLARNGGGVSACAVCDGALPMFRDQPVAVIGGGDSALEEANYLTKFASKVHLIHRRDALRGSKVMQQRFIEKPNATVEWNKVVEECLSAPDDRGTQKLTAIRLKDTVTGELSELPVKGMFVAIGHTPTTKFLKDSGLEFDDAGYILLKSRSSRTNIAGVFAAGDVADSVYRQAITASGMGCQAAIDAEHWLGDMGLN